MKRYLLVFLLGFVFLPVSYSQQSFKYIIISTSFPDIAKGFNPYNVSSSLQKVLTERGIKTVLESDELPTDFCEALTVEIEKIASFFSNKLEIKLKDCQNRVVWKNIGSGHSKEYVEGYYEAIVDAFSKFTELPQNTVANKPAPETPPSPEIQPPAQVAAIDAVEEPTTIFFNDKYIVNLVTETEKTKNLIVVNGQTLGYDKLQNIAVLTSTDLPGMHTIEMVTPEGNKLRGIAELDDSKLKIILSSDNEPIVITLMKKE